MFTNVLDDLYQKMVVGEKSLQQEAGRLLDYWRDVQQDEGVECIWGALQSWNKRINDMNNVKEGDKMLQRFMGDYSFDIFDRLVDYMKRLTLLQQEDSLSRCKEVERAFLVLSENCSPREFYMMTMELFSRESLTTDFYITALFLVHTCLLTTWTKRLDQLCNGSVAVKHNRHIESAITMLQKRLKPLEYSNDDDEDYDEGDDEDNNTTVFNTFDISSLSCVSDFNMSELSLVQFVKLAREDVKSEGGDGNRKYDSNVQCSRRLSGLLLLLKGVINGWVKHTRCVLNNNIHEVSELSALNACEQELEVLTCRLLDIIAYIASHCSSEEVRRPLCAFVASMITFVNNFEVEIQGICHPYVMLPKSRCSISAGGGYGAYYILNHLLRVRHAIVDLACRQMLGSSNAVSLSDLQPVTSSQKRSVQLKSESEGAKKALFNKVWKSPINSPPENLMSGNPISCAISTQDLVPWSAVTPASWKRALEDFEALNFSRRKLEMRLRLRRGACLDWNLDGVALFVYYFLATDPNTEKTTHDISPLFASSDQSTNYMYLNMLLPAAFLLLGHDIVKACEGVLCASSLPSLSLSSHWITPQTSSELLDHFPPLNNSNNYVSSGFSFDWREDIVQAYRECITDKRSGKEFTCDRYGCLLKGATVISLQNSLSLCQLIVNALMGTPDRIIQRKGQIALRWTVFKLHSFRLGASACQSLQYHIENDISSFILLRRLVDMCPFPAAKGLLTDVAKDGLPFTFPFRDARVSHLCIELHLPPPPLPPHAVSKGDSSNSASSTGWSLDESTDEIAKEHFDELQAVRYSEALDMYMINCANALCKPSSPAPQTWHGFPLRIFLELFVVPPLQALYSLRRQSTYEERSCHEGDYDYDLADILDKMDWFSSAVALLRFIVLKLKQLHSCCSADCNISINLTISDELPPIMKMIPECRCMLQDHVDNLKSYQQVTAIPKKRDHNDLLRGQRIEKRSDPNDILKLELVLMNMDFEI